MDVNEKIKDFDAVFINFFNSKDDPERLRVVDGAYKVAIALFQ